MGRKKKEKPFVSDIWLPYPDRIANLIIGCEGQPKFFVQECINKRIDKISELVERMRVDAKILKNHYEDIQVLEELLLHPKKRKKHLQTKK